MADSQFAVTWKRSAISQPRTQREIIRSLGLRKLNQTVTHPDTPAVRGMIHKVRHLVEVAVIEEEKKLVRKTAVAKK